MGNIFAKLETHINKNALIFCICLAPKLPENDQRAAEYIKIHFFVHHCTRKGESPLYLSLLHNKDYITLMLLIHGADPNAQSKVAPIFSVIPHPYDPLLWCLSVKNVSQIKLVTLYGANIERFSEATLRPFTSEMLQVYAEARAHYSQIQKLESFIKSDAPRDQQLKALYELQKIWRMIGQEEDNSIFRQHYFEQALRCKDRGENLRAGFGINSDSVLEPLLEDARATGNHHPC